MDTHTDCRYTSGILVGLLVSIITSARVYRLLANNTHIDAAVREALKDLKSDPDLFYIMTNQSGRDEVVCRSITEKEYDSVRDYNLSICQDGSMIF